MKFSNEEIDKFSTLGMITVGFLVIIYMGSISMDFQKRCELRCGDQPALTPLVDLEEKCLCGEGNGRWRIEDIGAN